MSISTGAQDPSLKCIYEITTIANNKRANNYFTVMLKIMVPLFIIPIACLSFGLYYLGGLGVDAFHLICPEL